MTSTTTNKKKSQAAFLHPFHVIISIFESMNITENCNVKQPLIAAKGSFSICCPKSDRDEQEQGAVATQTQFLLVSDNTV